MRLRNLCEWKEKCQATFKQSGLAFFLFGIGVRNKIQSVNISTLLAQHTERNFGEFPLNHNPIKRLYKGVLWIS